MDPTELNDTFEGFPPPPSEHRVARGSPLTVVQPTNSEAADRNYEEGEHDEGESDEFDDLFERDLRQMGEQVGGAVGAVVNGIKGTWTENKVGERAKSMGLGAIRCIRRKPGQLVASATAGLNLITDAADFWVRDMCENQADDASSTASESHSRGRLSPVHGDESVSEEGSEDPQDEDEGEGADDGEEQPAEYGESRHAAMEGGQEETKGGELLAEMAATTSISKENLSNDDDGYTLTPPRPPLPSPPPATVSSTNTSPPLHGWSPAVATSPASVAAVAAVGDELVLESTAWSAEKDDCAVVPSLHRSADGRESWLDLAGAEHDAPHLTSVSKPASGVDITGTMHPSGDSGIAGSAEEEEWELVDDISSSLQF